MKSVLYFAMLLGLAMPVTQAQTNLCKPKEEVLFSCSIGKKMASLCGSTTGKSVYYIFGTKNRTELKINATENKKFKVQYHNEFIDEGVERTIGKTLRFFNGNTEYIIYSHRFIFNRQSGWDGIYIRQKGNEIADLSCSQVRRDLFFGSTGNQIMIEEEKGGDDHFIKRYRLKINEENPDDFASFIDENTKLLQFVTIPLSTGQNAVLMALEHIDWQGDDNEKRFLKILMKDKKDNWYVSVKTDNNVIHCATCSGRAGDVLEPITRSIDSFTIFFQYIKGNHSWVFNYDESKHEWYLSKLKVVDGNDFTYVYPDDFRYISLQSININNDIDNIINNK